MSFIRETNMAVERKKKNKTWATNEGETYKSDEELLLALAQKITVWKWWPGQSQCPEDEGESSVLAAGVGSSSHRQWWELRTSSADRSQRSSVDKKNFELSSQNVNKVFLGLPLFPGCLNGLGTTHIQKDKGTKVCFMKSKHLLSS